MNTITVEIDSFNSLQIVTAEDGMTATVRHLALSTNDDDWTVLAEWQIKL